MPIRSPLGLGFALAALVLAQSGARAEPSAGTWTDPPAKSVVPAAKPAAPAAKPAEPPRAEPAQERAAKPVAAAAAPAQVESVKRKPVRAARAASPRRAAAVRAARRPEPSVRSAAVRPVRVARPLHRDWPAAEPVYDVVPRAYDPRDPRLERLWSAEEAGYLAVRGRHVAYPDGRTLRIYRPSRDDEDLD